MTEFLQTYDVMKLYVIVFCLECSKAIHLKFKQQKVFSCLIQKEEKKEKKNNLDL